MRNVGLSATGLRETLVQVDMIGGIVQNNRIGAIEEFLR